MKANVIEFRGKKFLQRNQINRPQERILKGIGATKPPKILGVVTKK